MILLSAHKDTVIQPYDLSFCNEGHKGLLDNMAGIIACYGAIYGNPSLLKMVNGGELAVFHSNHEEFAIDDLPEMSKEDIVIVVDVASGEGMDGKDFSLENIANVSEERAANLKESLEWEGYSIKFKYYDGTPDDEDEAWTWMRKGIPVMSFIIPIDAPNDNWHGNATLSSEKMHRAMHGLARTICYLS